MRHGKSMPLIETTRRVHFKNREAQFFARLPRLAFQLIQQSAANAPILECGHQVYLLNEPVVVQPFDTHQANWFARELNNLVTGAVKIGKPVPASPSLFCVNPHAGFGDFQGKGRIFDSSWAKRQIMHSCIPLAQP